MPAPSSETKRDLLQDDEVLRRRFRQGDTAAMATVFDSYSEPLTRFLGGGFSFTSKGKSLRFPGLHQRADLHDVLADTFRAAFEQRARLAYTGLAPYGAYLRTIARNIVIDRLRSQESRWVELNQQTVEHGAGAAISSPERAYLDRELSQLMERFMAGLAPAERRFVELRFSRGLGQQVVAQQLNKSRRWVRTTEQDLRRQLVRAMRDTGYLPGGARR